MMRRQDWDAMPWRIMIVIGDQVRRLTAPTWPDAAALIQRVMPLVPEPWRERTLQSLSGFRETPWGAGWVYCDDRQTFRFTVQKSFSDAP